MSSVFTIQQGFNLIWIWFNACLGRVLHNILKGMKFSGCVCVVRHAKFTKIVCQGRLNNI